MRLASRHHALPRSYVDGIRDYYSSIKWEPNG